MTPPASDDARSLVITVLLIGVIALAGLALLVRKAFDGFGFGFDAAEEQIDDRPVLGVPPGGGSGGASTADGSALPPGLDWVELARQSDIARRLLEAVLAARSNPNAISDETILRFSSDEAFRRFLDAARKAGLDVRGILAPLRAVRIGTDDLQALRDALEPFADDLSSLESNYYVSIPDLPIDADPRNPTLPSSPFGGGTLAWLGATGDPSQFGRGVTVAVLDSGITRHPSLDGAVILSFDLVNSASPKPFVDEIGHGTAVSSIIVSQAPDAPGIAPAARLLNYRVTGEDGLADAFTLTQGIFSAVDEGAQLINISLGSYSGSAVLADAMVYAAANNVLIIASSGNDALADASYPARYESAVAVGANDTNGLQLYFSNSSPNLDLSAPGDRLTAAAPNSGYVSFSGTSAAAPVATAALAAVMSEMNISDPTAALALLQGTANEGGGPGADADYGSGVVNVGRALSSRTRGIVDAAVTYPYLDADNSFGYGENAVLFMVENRGTEPLANVPITVTSQGQQYQEVFSRLMPNEVGVFAVDADPAALTAGEALIYDIATQSATQTDSVPGNNSLRATLLPGDTGSAPPGNDGGNGGGSGGIGR